MKKRKPNTNIKGIILAAGKATRLFPVTLAVNKQLLNIFDKPMVYYPLSVLMLSNIREILIITRPKDLKSFKCLLGNGNAFGITIKYAIQKKSNGIAEAFLIGKKFLSNSNCALILGDNIFYGQGLKKKLESARSRSLGGTIFSYPVNDPQRFGVAELDKNKNIKKLTEKPKNPKSNLAVTGLYFYDNQVVKIAKSLKPSKRGELEITDINKIYLKKKQLHLETFNKKFAWLDTGTPESLLSANNFIATTERKNKIKIACLEEIAYQNNWITRNKLRNLIKKMSSGSYKNYLSKMLKK